MAVFSYRAIDERELPVQSSITADSARQARDLIRDKGLRIQTIREESDRTSKFSAVLAWRIGVSSKITPVIHDLSTLLTAGVVLSDALNVVALQARGKLKFALLQIADKIAAGGSLAEAAAEHPDYFDPLSVHMITVGENSGNLDRVLTQLADFKTRSNETKDRVLSALIYPAIVMTVGLCVALFLMTVVVPELLNNLIESGQALPWPTRVLQTMSHILLEHGLLFGMVGTAVVASMIALLRSKSGRLAWHRALLRVPVVGSMAIKQDIARVALIIATLMRSGIEYLRALEIAAQSSDNLVIRNALEESGRLVGDGADIGPSLEQTGVFPPMVIHILRVGQETGKLEDMLERLSKDYERQVETLAGRLASLLEPILIVGLAAFVGFILLATFLPILEAGNVL